MPLRPRRPDLDSVQTRRKTNGFQPRKLFGNNRLTIRLPDILSSPMTRETLYNIRKFLVKARVASHSEEQEFFDALNALDHMINATKPPSRVPQQVN